VYFFLSFKSINNQLIKRRFMRQMVFNILKAAAAAENFGHVDLKP